MTTTMTRIPNSRTYASLKKVQNKERLVARDVRNLIWFLPDEFSDAWQHYHECHKCRSEALHIHVENQCFIRERTEYLNSWNSDDEDNDGVYDNDESPWQIWTVDKCGPCYGDITPVNLTAVVNRYWASRRK